MKALLCSNCFRDQGLKLDAFNMGIEQQNTSCPNCNCRVGRKLDKELITLLAYRFFVRGSARPSAFWEVPAIQFNQFHHKSSTIDIAEWLNDDIKLIENAIGVGFYYHSPRLWMIGEVEPLKRLKNPQTRLRVIGQILSKYPVRSLCEDEIFYRLRRDPQNPSDFAEYDSPPNEFLGKGRFDSPSLPVMYASQDLEICVHECRVTVDDELFFASLTPTRELTFLNLTEITEPHVNEFESLDMAIHMLFNAGSHSYEITRTIAHSASEMGLDGILYPSYFSSIQKGSTPFETAYGIPIRKFPFAESYVKDSIAPNIALFGRPIRDGLVSVKCLNRLVLQQVRYNIQFGPVHKNTKNEVNK